MTVGVERAKEKRIRERGIGNYSVYRHTSPSGNIYIGITSQKPEQRWGKAGQGYRTQKIFSSAIEKYGWSKIKHEVLFTKLTKEKAIELESSLISHYKKLKISYNVSDGEGFVQNSNEFFGPIYQIEVSTGDIIKKWNSVVDIEIELGLSRKYIKDCINTSKLKTAFGYLWVLSDEYDKLSDFEKENLISSIQYNKSCKSIRKVDINTGEVVRTWGSISEAVRDCPECTVGGISNVVLGKSKTYKGYFWEFVDSNDKKRATHKNTELKTRSIYQIDKITKNIIREWNCIDNIIEDNNDYSYFNIARCLQSTATSTYGGYFWVYKDEYESLRDLISSINLNIGRSSRNILQIDPFTLNIIKDWSGYKLKDIVNSIGNNIKDSDIITCCGYPGNGRSQKTSKGYVWQYKEVFENLTKEEKEKLKTKRKI